MKAQIMLESLTVIAVYLAMIAVVMSSVIYMKQTVSNNYFAAAATRIAENTVFRLDMQAVNLPSHRAETPFKPPTEYKGYKVYYKWVNGSVRAKIGENAGGAKAIHRVVSSPDGRLQPYGIDEEPI